MLHRADFKQANSGVALATVQPPTSYCHISFQESLTLLAALWNPQAAFKENMEAWLKEQLGFRELRA